MAVSYVIQGPVVLRMGTDAGSLSDVGYSTNEDLFRVSVERLNRVVRATDTGAEPGQVIHVGVRATISGTLSKWDAAAIADFMVPPGSATVGQAGVIGRAWVQQSHLFTVQLGAVSSLGYDYTFDECVVDGQAFRLLDFGNDNLKLACTFTALREGQDGSSATAVVADIVSPS